MEKRIKKVSFDESARSESVSGEGSVKTLLKRFESIQISERKVEPAKPALVRSQTMRNPAKFQHHKPRIVPKPKVVFKDLSSPENIYENLEKPPNTETESVFQRTKKPLLKISPNSRVDEEIYENLLKNCEVQIQRPGSLDDSNVYETIGSHISENIYEVIEVDSKATQSQIPELPSLTKVQMIISDLLQNEVQYISNLRRGIEAYIQKLKFIQLPDTLIGKRVIIFSNIEHIYEFHKRNFLPMLIQCGYDPEKVANAFIVNIENSFFDQYILYAQNNRQSQQLCIRNQYFFQQLDKDSLGINSFLLQPIQRLPRYRLIIDELVKELLKDVKANKVAITRCCTAERKLNELLGLINEQCK